MKVIASDNFARETVDDWTVATDLTPEAAEALAEKKNGEGGDDDPWFYRVVPDDYVLQRWKP